MRFDAGLGFPGEGPGRHAAWEETGEKANKRPCRGERLPTKRNCSDLDAELRRRPRLTQQEEAAGGLEAMAAAAATFSTATSWLEQEED